MLGTGRLAEYLKWYENLNKYSQQGWEYQNKCVNGVYHWHTQWVEKGIEMKIKVIYSLCFDF